MPAEHTGYMNRVLRVNLTERRISVEALSEKFRSQYIGGVGLGARLLYDESVPGSSPLDPGNSIIICTGPVTGTLIPGSGTYTIVARNMLTGFTAAAQSNGFFGARLKYAGYDALIIEGQADRLVYLHIDNDRVEIEDAAFLQGKGTFATDAWLRKKYGEQGVDNSLSVAAIGPAGENLVRFACVMSDRGHIASTGGIGALLGNKKLKAISVRGDNGIPIPVEKRDLFLQSVRDWRRDARESGLGKTVHNEGTIGLFKNYHQKGWVPVKNMTTNIFSDAEKFTTEYIRNRLYESVPRSCFNCTFNHCHTVRVTRGPYKGAIGEEVEYEILAGFGPNWGINEPGATTMLNTLNDDLGMDAKETTFLLSMLMEGYEKGWISQRQLDGVDLRWGSPEAAAELLRKVSKRDGIGAVLAEGVMRAAQELGKGFPEAAVYVKKGNAPHVHDVRTRWGTLFSQIVSDMGSIEGLDFTGKAAPEIGVEKPTSEPDEYLGEVTAITEWWRQFQECMTYCYFQTASPRTMVSALNALTGSACTVDDALQIGKRTVCLLRMLNLREGLTRDHDSFSPRLKMPPMNGPGKGKSLEKTFEQVLHAYYAAAGWDESGRPTPALLHQLDLDFTVPALN